MILSLVVQVADKDDPFAIGRRMGKPVGESIIDKLLLVASVGFHPPYLHCPAPERVEVKIPAIGRKVGAIVQPFFKCKPRFFASTHSDGINIKVPVAFGAVSQGFTIGTPAMPEG